MKQHDYIKLAQAIKGYTLSNIKNINANNGDDTPVIFAHGFISELCDILAADNPKFDKVKFMEACKWKNIKLIYDTVTVTGNYIMSLL